MWMQKAVKISHTHVQTASEILECFSVVMLLLHVSMPRFYSWFLIPGETQDVWEACSENKMSHVFRV